MMGVRDIQEEVKKLYHENSDDMASGWLYDKHVKIVADFSRKITKTEKADSEICILAALLHDIARVKGIWDDPDLMDGSFQMTEEIMARHGYDKKRIEAVKEAMRLHSCKEGKPQTQEGKVLATADGLAHVMSDFYLVLPFKKLRMANDPESYKKWVSKNLGRDFHKIFFPAYKRLARKRYDALKLIFSETKS